MVMVTARTSFEHGGRRRPGDEFDVSEHQAKQLAARGLVHPTVSDNDPSVAAGELSSASQAAQALPQTTAKPSGRGGKRKKAAG